MYIKNKVVIFTENNAIVKIVEDISPYKNRDNCYINPDLSKVKNIHKHFWKIEDNQIVEMTRPEKIKRLSNIDKEGSNPEQYSTIMETSHRKYYKDFVYIAFFLGIWVGIVTTLVVI